MAEAKNMRSNTFKCLIVSIFDPKNVSNFKKKPYQIYKKKIERDYTNKQGKNKEMLTA